jgi:hypothetical protein
MVDSMLAKNAFKSSASAVCFSVLGLGLLLLSSGCSTMFQNVATPAIPAETPVASDGSYYVELHPAIGKPTIFKGELNGPVTVQQALEESGATKKFRGMRVGLFRIVKENGRPLKLPIEYTYRTSQVEQHQNYALLPEDRIVVAAKTSNIMAEALKAFHLQ